LQSVYPHIKIFGIEWNSGRIKLEGKDLRADSPADDRLEAMLYRRLAAGDREAFAEIMKLYRAAALNFAYRFLGDFDEAEDAAQDCFVKIFQNCRRFDPARPFKTWFYTILINCCRDRIRHKNRFAGFLEKFKDTAETAADPPDLSAGESAKLFQQALAKMEPSRREIIILRFNDDLSYKEIARTLGISEGTVMSRLFRAKKELEKIIKALGVAR